MKLPITNFSRGEFGPQLYGRVDVPQYAAGAKRIRNWIIQRYGGLAFRPGFRFVGEVDVTKTYNLLPFQYSIDQAYVLALGDSTLNVFAGGGFVVEEDLKITGITKGLTTILTIPYHGYAIGDTVYFDGTDLPLLNGRFLKVLSVPSANQIEVNVNSINWGDLSTSTGTERSAPPAPVTPPEPPPPAPPAPPPPPPTTTPDPNPDFDPGTWKPWIKDLR